VGATNVLPALPPELKARLLDAFDIQILWNKPGRQATIFGPGLPPPRHRGRC